MRLTPILEPSESSIENPLDNRLTRRAKHRHNGIIETCRFNPRRANGRGFFISVMLPGPYFFLVCLLALPLRSIGALNLVAAIGQLSALASEMSVVDDPEYGLVVDLLEHQVLEANAVSISANIA
ncbi:MULTISPECIES: hypothetical protein [unclassified Bradyrhizobium]